MRNIIIYSSFSLVDSTSAASNRMIKYAKSISDSDVAVYIISKDFKPGENEKINKFHPNCYFVGESKRNRVNYYSLVNNIYKFSKSLIGEVRFLLYPSNSFMLDFYSFLFLLKRKKEKIYVEINERRIYYREWNHLKSTKIKNLPTAFLQILYMKIKMHLSELFIGRFSGMIFISRNIQKYFSKKNKCKKEIRIPILSEKVTEDFTVAEYSTSNIFNICFTGQVNLKKENLDLVIKSIFRLKKEGYLLELNLYGPLISKQELEELQYKYQLQSEIKYHGVLDYKDMLHKLAESNLLILVRGNTKQNYYGFSTKLSDYISSGVPVLVTKTSDVEFYFKDLENAFVIEPDSEIEIYNKLKFIINNYNKYAEEVVKGAINLVNDNFYYKNFSDELRSFMLK